MAKTGAQDQVKESQFMGFPVPKENWSKLPHILFNYLADMSHAELKVVLYVLRHTWGFSEFGKLKRITLDEFRCGRKKRDGSRMDTGTGLSVNAIKDGISRAVERGFLAQVLETGRDAGRRSHNYMLNMEQRVSKNDDRVSKNDSRLSENDTRSEKETLERNLEKSLSLSPKTTPEPTPVTGSEPLSESPVVIESVTEQPVDYADSLVTFFSDDGPKSRREHVRDALAAALNMPVPDTDFLVKRWDKGLDALVGEFRGIYGKRRLDDELAAAIIGAIGLAKAEDGWEMCRGPSEATVSRIVAAGRNGKEGEARRAEMQRQAERSQAQLARAMVEAAKEGRYV